MRLLEWVPIHYDQCPYKKGTTWAHRHTRGKHKVKVKAEMGVMLPQAKQRPAGRQAWSRFSLQRPEEATC